MVGIRATSIEGGSGESSISLGETMNFFKKLFCKHAYPEVVFTTECYRIVECLKCGKKKRVERHAYREIKRFYCTKDKEFGSIIGVDQSSHSIKVVYECQHCHDITSRDFQI